MPQEPKKRHSRQRQGKRRSSIKLSIPNTAHRLAKFYKMLDKDKAGWTKGSNENA